MSSNKIRTDVCKNCGESIVSHGGVIWVHGTTVPNSISDIPWLNINSPCSKAVPLHIKFEKTEDEWCCWMLSRKEILRAAEEVLGENYAGRGMTEDEIHQIVEDFKDKLSIMAEEWEEALKEAVKNNIIENYERAMDVLSRDVENLSNKGVNEHV